MLMQQRAVSLPIVTPCHRAPWMTASFRGHNLREYKDQLKQLEKENFYLRCHLFLLEEMEWLKVMCSFSLRVFVWVASVTAEQP
jgi:hypothetical protein